MHTRDYMTDTRTALWSVYGGLSMVSPEARPLSRYPLVHLGGRRGYDLFIC
jgi:hypothetical protein